MEKQAILYVVNFKTKVYMKIDLNKKLTNKQLVVLSRVKTLEKKAS